MEVILTRLRIGHTRMTHSFLLTGDSAPECIFCDLPLTVEHLLVHCTQYDPARQRFQLANKSIAEILGPDVVISSLFGFLEDVGVLQAL